MRCLAAPILAFTCLVAGGAETSVDSAADAEYSNPNLRHAVRSYRDGELEEAWSALVRFFEDAGRQEDFADVTVRFPTTWVPSLDRDCRRPSAIRSVHGWRRRSTVTRAAS